MTTYGYARVSCQDQHLDGQILQLEIAGCDVIFQEKATGTKADKTTRPEFNRMLVAATTGDVIVVAKLDRAARSTEDLLALLSKLTERGVGFKALNMPEFNTTTPTGKLMLTMLGAIAEFERGMMLERQKDGIARARAEGKYKGRAPTAQQQAPRVMALLGEGHSKARVAEMVGIGIASVYRIAAAGKGVSP